MKAKNKKLLMLLLACVMTVVGTVMAIAATPTADDFKVIVDTDKDSYSEGDDIYMSIKVENNSDATISNVALSYDVPEDITDNIVDYDKLPTSLDSVDEGVTTVFSTTPENPNTGVSDTVMMLVGIMLVAGGIVIVAKTGCLKKFVSLFMVVAMVVSLNGVAGLTAQAATHTFDVEGSKTITYADEEKSIVVKAKITVDAEDGAEDDSTDDTTPSETVKHVTVHDPSIVKDPETGMYYVFGSHMAWAKSEDLINWTTFTNNINRDHKTLFADAAEWSAKGGTQGSSTGAYDVSGNLWAPDVIYNEELGKWCMYMSVNGDYWYTSVVMLTADSLEGDWTVVGPVVYSGFTNADEAAETDFYDVYSGTDFPARYTQNRNGNRTYGMNAIDPCVFYDEDGKMWMVYGSWFGGLYMIELDPATGMRLASHTYETIDNESDEYQGIKIAGGQHVSGEAPYIEYNDGYYYLYVTLGGLTANGGYNMRVFRSEDVTGPYVDLSGDDARYTSARNNINYTIGNRVMSYYKWDYMDYGYTAQGHNSALLDDDGKMYVIYHTRFDNQGEGHQVRVHQQFVNEDGWLVTAPFEYYNETLTAVETTDVVGAYSVLVHKLGIDYENKECVTSVNIMLAEDGTVSGDLTGTWEFGTDGAPYVTMEIGNATYKGVFIEQKMEESSTRTMTFTVLGSDEINVWGYRLAGADEDLANEAAEALTMPIGAMADISLPATGLNATTITWESSNTAIIANNGTVTRPDTDTVVTMTATVTYGEASVEKEFPVKVFAEYDTTEDKVIWTYAEDGIDISSAVKGTYQYLNPLNKNNVVGLNINSGVSIKFHVSDATAEAWTNNIVSFNTNATGGLWVNDTAYLGYNANGFFDANLHNGSYTTGAWTAGTNFISDECDVEVKITVMGFEYYVDGQLVYSNTDVPTDEVPGQIDAAISYLNVLTYLNSTATVMNLGWGGFWEGAFKGTVSDVTISVLGIPEENVDTSDYVWYEFFTLGNLAAWNSPTSSMLSKYTIENDGTERGNYVHVISDGGSGNRTAYMTFDSEANVSGTYRVSLDATLTAGVLTQRSVSMFAIAGTDVTRTTSSDINSGYIVKLTNRPPEGTAANQTNTTKQNKWTINDANNTEITIPVGTWVNITADVDTNEGKAVVVIKDAANSSTVYYEGVVIINGTGTLGGIDVLVGRGVGKYDVDSITVELLDEVEFPEVEEPTLPTVTATSTGTAYLDKASDVTVTFTGDADLSTYKVTVNGTEVAANTVVDKVTVKSITYGATDCTVVLTVAEVGGWHKNVGSYDVAMVAGTETLATQNVSYDLSLSADTAYTQIATTVENANSTAWFKVEGTKLYAMYVVKSSVIHCDGLQNYGWYNGINAEGKVVIDSTTYSVGSHVYQDTWANPIGWNATSTLIEGASVVRSYMALGTFSSDTDTDTGCVLLNVVDLADIGLTEAPASISFTGVIGPNDGGSLFMTIDDTKTYTIE